MIINVKNCNIIELKQVVDETDGVLSIAENHINIPFQIRRVYYIYGLNSPQAKRGHHAHKILEQAIFCINGSFKLMVDDGKSKQYLFLNNPNQGIYLGKHLWHTMFDFSKDCILLVFASDLFNESDYIRNYKDFMDFLKNDPV